MPYTHFKLLDISIAMQERGIVPGAMAYLGIEPYGFGSGLMIGGTVCLGRFRFHASVRIPLKIEPRVILKRERPGMLVYLSNQFVIGASWFKNIESTVILGPLTVIWFDRRSEVPSTPTPDGDDDSE
jgi:hypothetical protein